MLSSRSRSALLGALDAAREKIRSELDEAQRQLHEEAKALLAKYQRQLAEGEKLAGEIRPRPRPSATGSR